MAEIPKLYPSNDFAMSVKLKVVDPLTLVKAALTSGTVTAFLSASNGPTSVAADPSLSMSPAHISGGKWAVFFDANVLSPALLATHFAAATPYLLLVSDSGVRAYVELEYSPSRPGIVT